MRCCCWGMGTSQLILEASYFEGRRFFFCLKHMYSFICIHRSQLPLLPVLGYVVESCLGWHIYKKHKCELLTTCHRSCLFIFSHSYSHLPRQYTGLHNSAVKQQMPLPTMLFLYRFWLTEICICCKPCPTRDELHDLQIALLTMLTLPFFYTSGSLHTRHIHTIFKLWGRSFCSSLLVCFFLCCYERNSIHTASLSHFIFLVHLVHHLFFIQLWTIAEFM